MADGRNRDEAEADLDTVFAAIAAMPSWGGHCVYCLAPMTTTEELRAHVDRRHPGRECPVCRAFLVFDADGMVSHPGQPDRVSAFILRDDPGVAELAWHG